jgi:hypothetical protein
MNICPNCKQEFKQRKDGCCPNCGVEIAKHGKYYYLNSIGSPSLGVLEHFERLVSERTSKLQNKRIVYQVPRRSARYQRELVEAQRLLDVCEGDFSLVTETIDTLFKNPQFYANFSTLIGIQGKFLLAKTITEANRAEKAAADDVEALAFDRVMERENIFA